MVPKVQQNHGLIPYLTLFVLLQRDRVERVLVICTRPVKVAQLM